MGHSVLEGLGRRRIQLQRPLFVAACESHVAKPHARERLGVSLHVLRRDRQPGLELACSLLMLATSQVQESERVQQSGCHVAILGVRPQPLLVSRQRRVVIASQVVDASKQQLDLPQQHLVLRLLPDVLRRQRSAPGGSVVAERVLAVTDPLIGSPFPLSIALLCGQLLHDDSHLTASIEAAIIDVLDHQIIEERQLEIGASGRTDEWNQPLICRGRFDAELGEQRRELGKRRERRHLHLRVGDRLPAGGSCLQNVERRCEVGQGPPALGQLSALGRPHEAAFATTVSVGRRSRGEDAQRVATCDAVLVEGILQDAHVDPIRAGPTGNNHQPLGQRIGARQIDLRNRPAIRIDHRNLDEYRLRNAHFEEGVRVQLDRVAVGIARSDRPRDDTGRCERNSDRGAVGVRDLRPGRRRQADHGKRGAPDQAPHGAYILTSFGRKNRATG